MGVIFVPIRISQISRKFASITAHAKLLYFNILHYNQLLQCEINTYSNPFIFSSYIFSAIKKHRNFADDQPNQRASNNELQ